MNLSDAEEEECGSEDNDATPGCSGGDVSEGGASQSGEDEDKHSSKDGSSDHTSTSGRGSEDGQSSAAEQEDNTEDCEDAEGSDTNQEADCPWSEANSKDQNPGTTLLLTTCSILADRPSSVQDFSTSYPQLHCLQNITAMQSASSLSFHMQHCAARHVQTARIQVVCRRH